VTRQTGRRQSSLASTTIIFGHRHCQPSWSVVMVVAVPAVVVRSVVDAIHQGWRSWVMVVAVPAVVVRLVVVVIHQGWRSWSLPYRQLSSGRSSFSVVVGRSRCSNQWLSSGRSSFSVVVGRGSCSKAECEICGQGRAKAKKIE
jgi:hypothetical protein